MSLQRSSTHAMLQSAMIWLTEVWDMHSTTADDLIHLGAFDAAQLFAPVQEEAMRQGLIKRLMAFFSTAPAALTSTSSGVTARPRYTANGRAAVQPKPKGLPEVPGRAAGEAQGLPSCQIFRLALHDDSAVLHGLCALQHQCKLLQLVQSEHASAPAGRSTADAELQACAALSIEADLAAHACEEVAKQLLAAGVVQACSSMWQAHAGQGMLRAGVLHALPRLASTGGP